MAYSKLNHDIEVMKVNHKHEEQLLKMKQDMEINQLVSSCTHKYDDGTSSKKFAGTQWDSYYICEICSKNIS